MDIDARTEATLRQAYAAFNARDADAVIALMAADVEWPNGFEGGYVHGAEAVRSYWARQWSVIDPTVTPVRFVTGDEGVEVTVHQVVRSLAGEIEADRMVSHLYTLRDSLIVRMEIREAAASDERV